MKTMTLTTVSKLFAISTAFALNTYQFKTKMIDTYFFVYDESGVQLIYPTFPDTPPTTNPVNCWGPAERNCVAEYTGYTTAPFNYPVRYQPAGELITIWKKP